LFAIRRRHGQGGVKCYFSLISSLPQRQPHAFVVGQAGGRISRFDGWMAKWLW